MTNNPTEAIRIALTLAGYAEDQHANIVEATLYGLSTDDPLPAAEARLREIEGEEGVSLNMRGGGSQP